MPSVDEIFLSLQSTLSAFPQSIVEQLPGILGGIILLLIGWLLARLLRKITIKAISALNVFFERILRGRSRTVIRFSSGLTRLLGGIIFWLILFVFTTLALRTAGFTGVAAWLERTVEYLPSLLTGGLIILAGYVLGAIVKDVVQGAAESARMADAQLVSRLAQAVTFITALVVGMNQAGVDTSFITIMLGVSTATVLAGFSLAFGLGARTLVSNLIAAHYLRSEIEAGQTVLVGEWEGKVLELTATNVILDTPKGRTAIPAKVYQEQALSIILEGTSDD